MKNVIVSVLILCGISFAQSADDYPLKVHVISSQYVILPSKNDNGSQPIQLLKVTIDGKKYELGALAAGDLEDGAAILAIGDYKAKLVLDRHKTAYEFSQTYQLLLPDKRSRTFSVVGQME